MQRVGQIQGAQRTAMRRERAVALLCAWLLAAIAPTLYAQAPVEQAPVKKTLGKQASGKQVSAEQPDSIAHRSDQELTQLTARWGELSPAQRRALLAEVRTRMALKQRAARERRDIQVRALRGLPPSRTTVPPDTVKDSGGASAQASAEAREGQSVDVEVPNGAAGVQPGPGTRRVTIERRYGRIVRQSDGSVVVQQTRVVRSRGRSGRVTFGFGFERRARAGDGAADESTVTAQVPVREPGLPVQKVSEDATTEQR